MNTAASTEFSNFFETLEGMVERTLWKTLAVRILCFEISRHEAFVMTLCIVALFALTGANRAHANDIPVVEITAKRFAFSPDRINADEGADGQTASSQRGCDARFSSCVPLKSTRKFRQVKALR